MEVCAKGNGPFLGRLLRLQSVVTWMGPYYATLDSKKNEGNNLQWFLPPDLKKKLRALNIVFF